AQEVEAVFPELVIEQGGVKKVNYTGLVGVVIEAVKELKAKNDELERRGGGAGRGRGGGPGGGGGTSRLPPSRGTPPGEPSRRRARPSSTVTSSPMSRTAVRVSGGMPSALRARQAASAAQASARASQRGMDLAPGSTPCVASSRVMNARNSTGSPSVRK